VITFAAAMFHDVDVVAIQRSPSRVGTMAGTEAVVPRTAQIVLAVVDSLADVIRGESEDPAASGRVVNASRIVGVPPPRIDSDVACRRTS